MKETGSQSQSRVVWTLDGGSTMPESFIERHVAVFFVWGICNRIKYLRWMAREAVAA